MPRASILIPTYRRPHFLREAVQSALASSVRDIEVLVGDDGSRGATVCAEFDDARLRYLPNPHRLGMAGNWNMLLDAARSPNLALCMDDDRLDECFLERCLAVMETEPDVGVVFTNHRFDVRGELTDRASLLASGSHNRFARDLLRLRPVAVSAMVVRRAAWERVRPLPDTAAADMVLFGRLAQEEVVFHYVDEVLMTYRCHEDMLSSSVGFKDDVVRAWDSLHFADDDAEAHRVAHLCTALRSRARSRLEHGDGDGARSDLQRISSLSNGRLALTDRALGMLARAPRSGPLAATAVRRLRALTRGGAYDPAASGRLRSAGPGARQAR